MASPFHFPPELLQLLIDTIPRLCRGKKDVVLFFRGAGSPDEFLKPWNRKLEENPDSVGKFEIARDVLTKLNEAGDAALRARREVIKRVSEFEDFSTCWPSDVLKAKGLVAEVRRVVNVKDSFTRMATERESELRKSREERARVAEQVAKKRAELRKVHGRLSGLFSAKDPSKRGKELESVLNDLFSISGILVREAFARVGDEGEGVLEQVDGVIEFKGNIYLVEIKWLKSTVGIGDVSRHLVRIYGRGAGRGLFFSVTDYSEASVKACVEALSQKVVALCSVRDVLWLLENEKELAEYIDRKLHASIVDKAPHASVLSLL
jgi:hypothetical protein